MNKVSLGDKVADEVTGFTGIAIAEHNYLNGCTRYTVQPQVKKDGSLPKCETFDEPQLQVKKAKKVPVGSKETGGPDKFMDAGREE